MTEPNSEVFKHTEPKEVKTISPRQYSDAADHIFQEWKRRKECKERQEIEKRWTEVDRQISMRPAEKERKPWHPKFELPYQANALEVLSADADQLMFPGNGEWFNVTAQMTQDYLEAFEGDVRFLNGDHAEMDKFVADQTSLNQINKALLMNAHRQYNFQDKIKLSNSEAFKYGTRAVRVRAVKHTTFINEYHGVLRSESLMPVVAPISMKDFYPDDLAVKALAHGMHIRPTEMFHGKYRIADLKLAAAAGTTDTKDTENGGWLKTVIENISMKDANPNDPFVDFIETEGDLVIPVHNGKDIIARNMIVTVVFGKAIGSGGAQVARIRENPFSFNSVFWSQYYQDCIGVYGTSPLMKGASIQKMAQEAAEAVAIISRLQAQPPVKVSHSDPFFRKNGEYDLSPNAQVDSLVPPEPITIGDLQASAAVFSQMTRQHEDTVGVPPSRLGAQTKSHQTAYAIETEQSQGQSRTVAFVRAQERGFMTNILQAESEILRKTMKSQNIFVPDQGAYVVASGKAVAPDLTFNVLGSSTPLEERQKEAKMQQTIQSLIQVEQAAAGAGARPLNWDYTREYFLRQAFPSSEVSNFFSKPAAPPGESTSAEGPPVAIAPPVQ